MPGLSLDGAIDLIVDQQVDVFCFVLLGDAQLVPLGFEIDDLIGEVVMVGEGQLQLLDSLLHLGYVDQAFVKITVNVE